MKALKLVALGMVLFFASGVQAQVSVRFNLGSRPEWAPAADDDSRYYYLPDVEAYYDVDNSMFIYYEGDSWVHRTYLPRKYRNYDLYNGYKVGMGEYHGNTPYYKHREYRDRYSHGRNRSYQRTIGERPDREYYRDRNDRERNQVNRGRYNRIDGNDRHGDASYNRYGFERNQKVDRQNNNNYRNNDRDKRNDREKNRRDYKNDKEKNHRDNGNDNRDK